MSHPIRVVSAERVLYNVQRQCGCGYIDEVPLFAWIEEGSPSVRPQVCPECRAKPMTLSFYSADAGVVR